MAANQSAMAAHKSQIESQYVSQKFAQMKNFKVSVQNATGLLLNDAGVARISEDAHPDKDLD